MPPTRAENLRAALQDVLDASPDNGEMADIARDALDRDAQESKAFEEQFDRLCNVVDALPDDIHNAAVRALGEGDREDAHAAIERAIAARTRDDRVIGSDHITVSVKRHDEHLLSYTTNAHILRRGGLTQRLDDGYVLDLAAARDADGNLHPDVLPADFGFTRGMADTRTGGASS